MLTGQRLGFRTLGVVSTFIAGVEAQCLSLVADTKISPRMCEIASTFLICGLLLSVFGAAISLLAARWVE